MSKYLSFLENNEAELVKTLGLSEGELSVYLAALELGQANIQDISRKSGTKRASTYNFIDALKERQLISEIKKGRRKLYSAPYHPARHPIRAEIHHGEKYRLLARVAPPLRGRIRDGHRNIRKQSCTLQSAQGFSLRRPYRRPRSRPHAQNYLARTVG